MENASKALLIAGGVLIGVLLLALMVTLFASAREVSISYEERKQAEKTQQFNVNFIKYLGLDLTIHDVVTICNFAEINGVTITSGGKTSEDIYDDVKDYTPDASSVKKYKLEIESYEDGYVDSISFQ